MTDRQRRAAMGEIPADVVFSNAGIVNVYTDTMEYADVAVTEGVIVGIGRYQGEQEIDCTGKFLSPGFIDSHIHIESTMTVPKRLAEAVLTRGTTTLIADPHEAANVKGLDAIRYFLDQAQQTPMNFYFMLPSCVPAMGEDNSGASLSAKDLAALKDHPNVLGLGEMMDVPKVLAGDPCVLEKLETFSDMPIDGHAPCVSGKALCAYRLAGVGSDHECVQMEEVAEKLKRGFFISIREGSAARNLDVIVRALLHQKLPDHRLGFCTDDKHIGDILYEGHIDHNIRKAILLGMKPETAYRLATRNSADFYGLSHLGAIAPGKQADIVVLEDLEKVKIEAVWSRGKCVYSLHDPSTQKEDVADLGLGASDPPENMLRTVRLPRLDADSFAVPVEHETYPVIEIVPNQILTKKAMLPLPEKDGMFVSDGTINKIVIIERHCNRNKIGVAALKGMPIHGALASTVSHDAHNLIVTGDNDSDMIFAAQQLERCGGGYALVQDGKLKGILPLPICGLVCDLPGKELHQKLEAMLQTAHSMGVPKQFDPFTTLSFLALPVIPEIRVSLETCVWEDMLRSEVSLCNYRSICHEPDA